MLELGARRPGLGNTRAAHPVVDGQSRTASVASRQGSPRRVFPARAFLGVQKCQVGCAPNSAETAHNAEVSDRFSAPASVPKRTGCGTRKQPVPVLCLQRVNAPAIRSLL